MQPKRNNRKTIHRREVKGKPCLEKRYLVHPLQTARRAERVCQDAPKESVGAHPLRLLWRAEGGCQDAPERESSKYSCPY